MWRQRWDYGQFKRFWASRSWHKLASFVRLGIGSMRWRFLVNHSQQLQDTANFHTFIDLPDLWT